MAQGSKLKQELLPLHQCTTRYVRYLKAGSCLLESSVVHGRLVGANSTLDLSNLDKVSQLADVIDWSFFGATICMFN